MDYPNWASSIYPKLYAEAAAAGKKAREDGLPKVCNLPESYRFNGKVLNLWNKIWERGYDGLDETKID